MAHSHRGRCYFEPRQNGWEVCTVPNENGTVEPKKRRSQNQPREVTMYGSRKQFVPAERLAASSGPCLVSMFLIPFVVPVACLRALRARGRSHAKTPL